MTDHDATTEQSSALPAALQRILVVDDSVDAAESMAMLLRLRGFEVGVAHTGEDALRMADESPPSVVLLDIGLPGMSGYDVCRALRARDAMRDVKLIAMTGYGRESDRQRAIDAGFDAHATKPVPFATLLELLGR